MATSTFRSQMREVELTQRLLLILFAESLGVGLAVWMEKFLSVLLPGRFDFRRAKFSEPRDFGLFNTIGAKRPLMPNSDKRELEMEPVGGRRPDDGLERELNSFSELEGGVCTMCAPGEAQSGRSLVRI
jgi:hypothetical protein